MTNKKHLAALLVASLGLTLGGAVKAQESTDSDKSAGGEKMHAKGKHHKHMKKGKDASCKGKDAACKGKEEAK